MYNPQFDEFYEFDEGDEFERFLSGDTIAFKRYLSYIKKYWPELEDVPPMTIQEFFKIKHDNSREDLNYTLYKKIYIKLEQIRKRLVEDTLIHAL